MVAIYHLNGLQVSVWWIYCPWHQLNKKKYRWRETAPIRFFALCSSEPMFHFYCSSVGREDDRLTQERQDPIQPSLAHSPIPRFPLYSLLISTLACMPCGSKWKNGCKSENHKSQTGHSSVTTITSKHVQDVHILVHTSHTGPSGLCLHQCVQLR